MEPQKPKKLSAGQRQRKVRCERKKECYEGDKPILPIGRKERKAIRSGIKEMLEEERYKEFEKHQDQLLYPLYVIYLKYPTGQRRLQRTVDSAMRLRESRRVQCMKKQQEYFQKLDEEEEEQRRRDERRWLRGKHVEEVEHMLKKFHANLKVIPQENPEMTPLYGYDSPERLPFISGDTINGDLFLGDMDLE